MKSVVRISALLLLVTAWATLSGAQVTSAVIQGVVRDAQGGVVPGVVVKATNADTGLSREVPSDEAGLYRITALLQVRMRSRRRWTALRRSRERESS